MESHLLSKFFSQNPRKNLLFYLFWPNNTPYTVRMSIAVSHNCGQLTKWAPCSLGPFSSSFYVFIISKDDGFVSKVWVRFTWSDNKHFFLSVGWIYTESTEYSQRSRPILEKADPLRCSGPAEECGVGHMTSRASVSCLGGTESALYSPLLWVESKSPGVQF